VIVVSVVVASGASEQEKTKIAVDKFLSTPFIKAAEELKHSDEKSQDEHVIHLLKTPFVLAIYRLRSEKEQSEGVKRLFETPLLEAIFGLEALNLHA